ncbi:hypothetical protein RvY_09482-1 [Ramazzottius varieornatus]|uniref:Uncharacterized protein n=1 Tax=Ramazzottius varieornatus TaxID=947166 RepID=A0A1D1V9F5_RAMVA|nr:hypothetical protein RvY_09482-1 [Ramazzottius varieornatus]
MARNDERIGRVWVLKLAIFGRRIVCGQVQASEGRYGIQQVICISAKVMLFCVMWVVVAVLLMAGWVHAAQQLTLQQSMKWAGCSRCSIAKVWIQKGARSYDAKGIHEGLVEGGRMGRSAVVGTRMGEGVANGRLHPNRPATNDLRSRRPIRRRRQSSSATLFFQAAYDSSQ